MRTGTAAPRDPRPASSRSAPHIAVLLPNLAGGGAERAMLNIASGLGERGYRVDLVLAQAKGPLLSMVPSAVRLVSLAAMPPLPISKTIRLASYLRQMSPDYVLSALDIISSSTIARNLAGTATKVVMTVHTNLSALFNDKGGFGSLIRREIVRALYPKADCLVAVSSGIADDLARMIPLERASIDVVYNPVVPRDVDLLKAAPLEHAVFQPGGPPVVLAAGRLVREKNFEFLLRSFARIQNDTEAHLAILGDMDPREPDVRSRLQSLARTLGIADRFHLPGFVDNPYAYMARAAVFVLSSVYEGFGNVLPEAMAAGTTVVATDCPCGPREILDNGRYGRLVPVGDSAAMAAAILAALRRPDDPARLVQRARMFSFDAGIARYETLLRRDNLRPGGKVMAPDRVPELA